MDRLGGRGERLEDIGHAGGRAAKVGPTGKVAAIKRKEAVPSAQRVLVGIYFRFAPVKSHFTIPFYRSTPLSGRPGCRRPSSP